MPLELISLTGQNAQSYFEDIANLRMTLFHEFPYLYEGSMDYEANYLQSYFNSKNSHILFAFDEGKVVGCATGLPLSEEDDEMKKPFLKANLNPGEYYYIGEVLLLPAYRDQGILRKYLEFHENTARTAGYKYTTFMTVIRDSNDPAKPNNYKPLDKIWKHFGYVPHSHIIANFSWKSSVTHEEGENKLLFWVKKL